MNCINTPVWFKNCESFGRQLLSVRKARAETQKTFCSCLGISERALRELEYGEYVSPQILLQIQDFFKLSDDQRTSLCKPAEPLSTEEIEQLGLNQLVAEIFGSGVDSVIPGLVDGDDCIVIKNCIVNFRLLAGEIDGRPRMPFKVETNWLQKSFVPSPKAIQFLWEQQFRIQILALKRRHIKLRFRPLGKLVGFKETNGSLDLTLEPTDYVTFAITNLNLQDSQGNLTEYGALVHKLCGRSVALKGGYVASPLNVIVMVVSKDGCTFVPIRSRRVYERPLTWQASVGGAMEFGEQPKDTVIREAKEELGIDVDPISIHYLGLGINEITGEPDLLALVETSEMAEEIDKIFERKAAHEEFDQYKTWKLNRSNLQHIVVDFNKAIWSQPSDRAVVLLTLIRRFGKTAVEGAFAHLTHQPCSDDQKRYFTFVL